MTLMTERPTMNDTEPYDFEVLLATLDELDVPGFRAEIVGGSIVLSPWSKGYYLDVMELVCDRLRPYLPEDHRITTAPFLYVFPGDERAYGPDIHAASRSASRTSSTRLDGESLSLVAELTSSSTRDNDLTEKVRTYGRAGIPVYLLLDMQEEEVTVLSAPSSKGYEAHCTKPFGEKIHIPAPFDCELDTTGFRRPSS
ncbi:Uma2 family endonuclease [Streptomyces sp. S6]